MTTGPPVLVVADDLTGANATGALFARLGLRTRTVPVTGEEPSATRHPDVDVLVLVTASRHLAPHAAADRVRHALTGAGDPRLLVKRVDTTLRGPVAAELEALLTHVDSARHRVAALAVPAYPSAGRTTVGGIHLVDGVPLGQGPAARDPLTPITESRVARLLTAGTGLRATEVHLDDLDRDESARAEVLAAALDAADLTVVDAASDADIARLARTAADARHLLDAEIVIVDSGPFGAAYCDALGITGTRGRPEPILLVVGSMTDRTDRQLAVAETALDVRLTMVDDRVDVAAAASQAISAVDAGARVVGWRVRRPPGRVDTEVAAKIPAQLANAAVEVLTAHRIGGVFASGGEVAATVLAALGARGLDVEAEVQPLVVAGRVSGGRWDRLPVVTKGGLIGDDRAVLASIGHLQSMHATNTQQTGEVLTS